MSIPISIDPLGTLGSGRPLPPEYEQRKYLESWVPTGYNYCQGLKTGLHPKSTTRWEVKMRVVSGDGGNLFFMGCTSISSGMKMFIFHYGPQGFVSGSQGTEFDFSSIWDGAAYGVDLVCAIDNANKYIEITDGAGQGNRRQSSVVAPPVSDEIVLFKRGSENRRQSIRIYWSRIFEQGVLVQDLQPCVRKSDRLRGMYDFATGNFLVGSDLPGGKDFRTDDDSDLL